MARGSPQLVAAVVVVGCFGVIAHGQISGAFDTDGPRLSLTHTRWVAGAQLPALHLHDVPGVRRVDAWLDGVPVAVEGLQPRLPEGLQPGAYQLRVVATDEAWSRNRTEATWWLRVVAVPVPLSSPERPHTTP